MITKQDLTPDSQTFEDTDDDVIRDGFWDLVLCRFDTDEFSENVAQSEWEVTQQCGYAPFGIEDQVDAKLDEWVDENVSQELQTALEPRKDYQYRRLQSRVANRANDKYDALREA